MRLEAGFAGVIPQMFTRFFGRAEEVQRLCDWLQAEGTRLVTLSGIGGTGKTRLAQEVAHRLVDAFDGAVWFVSLADIADAALIPDAIATTMQLPPTQADRMEQIIAALTGQRSLLVLDNYEQLVADGVLSVRTLLERLPQLTCLVTSRQILALEGEREFFVSPLLIPRQTHNPEALLQYESVQLFVDRAQATKPDFQITPNNAGAVAALCAGLEGIPLALVLAASRIQMMSPAQMVMQLQHRLDFLVSRRRDISERQRTLRQALDWSYLLLSPELQRFLARLSVFRGGWSVAASEVVGQEPLALDHLAQLRECSLAMAEETGDTYRFRLFETVREYALEKLAESGDLEATQERHTAFFRTLLLQGNQSLQGTAAEAAEAITLLTADLDNIRAGMDWATQQGHDSEMLEFSLAITLFLLRRGLYSECEARLIQAEAVARRIGDRASLANLLNRRGLVGWNRSDYAAAEPHFAEARLLCQEIGDQSLLLKVLANLGNLSWGRSDFAKARSIWEEALELAVASGHARQEGTYRTNLAILACYRGDYETAARYYQEGLAFYQQVDFVEGIAFARYNFSELLLYQAQYARAMVEAKESLRLFSTLGDQQGMALATIRIGLLWLETGHNDEARLAFTEGLAKAEEIGIRRCEMYAFDGMARLAEAEDDPQTAQRLFHRSLRIAHEVGDRRQQAVTLARLAQSLLKREREADAYSLLVIADAECATLHLSEAAHVGELKTRLGVALGPQAKPLAQSARTQNLEMLLEKVCST